MECMETRKFVYVYLDGEFGPREQAEYEQHLQRCPQCRAEVRFEHDFREIVRQGMVRETAPAALRDRVRQSLQAAADDERATLEPRPQSLWDRLWALPKGFRLIPAVGVAALLAVLLWPRLPGPTSSPAAPGGDEVESLVAESVTVHRLALPNEVHGDRATINQFLAAQAGFRAAPPLPDDATTRLVGARLTHVRGRPAVLYAYERAGRRLSVLQMAEPATAAAGPFRRAYFTGQAGGYNVALFRDGDQGVANTVVGDIDEQDLLRLIPATYRR